MRADARRLGCHHRLGSGHESRGSNALKCLEQQLRSRGRKRTPIPRACTTQCPPHSHTGSHARPPCLSRLTLLPHPPHLPRSVTETVTHDTNCHARPLTQSATLGQQQYGHNLRRSIVEREPQYPSLLCLLLQVKEIYQRHSQYSQEAAAGR